MTTKPHLELDTQLELLLKRGLIVEDSATAIKALSFHNYYRLRGYFHVFLDQNPGVERPHNFKPAVNLTTVLDLVEFDRKLRAVLFEALSQFELRLRSNFAYFGGLLDPEIHITGTGLAKEFVGGIGDDDSGHQKWLLDYEARIDRFSTEEFVRWHMEQHDGKLPIWAAVEILDFGAISKLFRSTSQGLSSQIATQFGCTPSLLKSWTASMNDLRNAVVHQNRLWNRAHLIAPKTTPNQLPKDLQHLASLSKLDRNKIYPRLAILAWLDKSSEFGVDLVSRLRALISQFPENPHLDIAQMGFPDNWTSENLWSN